MKKSTINLLLFTSYGLYKRTSMTDRIFILILAIMCSCTNNSEKKKETHSLPQIQKNEKLISFRCKFVMNSEEMSSKSDKEFQQLIDHVNFYIETDTIHYRTDTLYISYLNCVNACGSYDGNIEFHNDSLFLKAIDIGEISCCSERIDRFIYKIYNPDNKKYKIIKDK